MRASVASFPLAFDATSSVLSWRLPVLGHVGGGKGAARPLSSAHPQQHGDNSTARQQSRGPTRSAFGRTIKSCSFPRTQLKPMCSQLRAPNLSCSFSSTSNVSTVACESQQRSLISLSGRDTYKLLQGLMTNDVRILEEQVKSRTRASASSSAEAVIPSAFYCAFLNPQGRLIATAFLYPHPAATVEEPHIILDCHKGNFESLLGFIKRFKLRSKVKISELGTEAAAEGQQGASWKVIPLWQQEEPMVQGSDIQLFRDPRTPSMGYRLVLPPSSSSSFSSTTGEGAKAESLETSASYEYHRLTQGVPDGPKELAENQALPLEANLDLMNGVDFRKGCYVGQELTARTHHTGVVRKRIMPVRIYAPPGVIGDEGDLGLVGGDLRANPTASDGQTKTSRRSKSAGKLLALVREQGQRTGASHIGLASLRLGLIPKQPFEQGGWLTMQSVGEGEGDTRGQGEGEWKAEAVWPDWWPEGLREEHQGGSLTASSED